MGPLHYFLGVKIEQNKKDGSIWIGQPAYCTSLLQKFGMENCKPVKNPVSTTSRLAKATEEDSIVDKELYQANVGSLLYLATMTRPDIAFAVSNVAKFCCKPNSSHCRTAVKRVLRYIKGTINLGLLNTKNESKQCIGFSDSDWGGDPDDHKSTSGYLFEIGGTAVSWRSKKQNCVALSTAEAEYMALAATAQEAIWLRRLTSEIDESPVESTTIYEDNQSAMCIAKNPPQFHGRTKHIGIKYHYTRDLINSGEIRLEYCPTEDMVADMLTKAVSQDQLNRLKQMCGMSILPSSEKEC